MWGHSAGAQFVHRFVLFKPRSAVRFAIAAAQRFLLDADRVLPSTCPLSDGDPCP